MNDGLKSESSKSAQPSESFANLETRPHLLLLFGLISPFLCSRPVRILCVYKERGKKAILGINGAHPRVIPILNFLGYVKEGSGAFPSPICNILFIGKDNGGKHSPGPVSFILHRLHQFSFNGDAKLCKIRI